MLIFLLTASVSAHEWYDAACCSGNDCHPVSCTEIIGNGKALVYKSWEFVNTMIRPSQDGLCHVCISNEFSIEMTPVPHCVYVLPDT